MKILPTPQTLYELHDQDTREHKVAPHMLNETLKTAAELWQADLAKIKYLESLIVRMGKA